MISRPEVDDRRNIATRTLRSLQCPHTATSPLRHRRLLHHLRRQSIWNRTVVRAGQPVETVEAAGPVGKDGLRAMSIRWHVRPAGMQDRRHSEPLSNTPIWVIAYARFEAGAMLNKVLD